MPRLEPLPLSAVPELEDVFEEGERLMGFLPNDGLTVARRPDVLRGLLALTQGVYGSPDNTLDGGLKRLIGEVASRAAGCQYCQAHAAHSAHRLGVDEAKLEALWTFETNDLFSEAERVALRLAARAALSPNAATDDDFAALKKHYDEGQIVEIVAVIALFGFLNRWNSTLQTSLEPGPSAFQQEVARRSSNE